MSPVLGRFLPRGPFVLAVAGGGDKVEEGGLESADTPGGDLRAELLPWKTAPPELLRPGASEGDTCTAFLQRRPC